MSASWSGGWNLKAHTSGIAPNGHDFFLHRSHCGSSTGCRPSDWPRPVQLPLTAALQGSSIEAPPSRDILLFVHGFLHTPADYTLHAAMLRRSHGAWLLRNMDTLLVGNSLAVPTDSLLTSLRGYPGALRMLVHTGLDAGHQCSEFQLLAATAHLWRSYRWVIYVRGGRSRTRASLVPSPLRKL